MQQGSSAINMGEVSGEMVAAMMQEMPLITVVNFSVISEEQLEEILAMLNG
jgi:hypothetical protein